MYSKTEICPIGWPAPSGGQCTLADNVINPQKNSGTPDANTCVGNPCNAATGNKFQTEDDYIGQGVYPLVARRYYNSELVDMARWGKRWRGHYDRVVILNANSTISTAVLQRHDGRNYSFNLNTTTNTWLPQEDVIGALERLTDGSGNPTGWKYINEEDEVETYDTSGLLTSIANRFGVAHALTYSCGPATSPTCPTPTPVNIAPMPGLLLKVEDAQGRTLNFTYDGQVRVVSMTTPDGAHQFTYDNITNSNLISATRPDSTIRQYRYNESAYTGGANLPNALTGIIDENNNRFATWNYNAQGKVTSSERGTGINKYTLAYSSGSTTVTDSFGVARTHNFGITLGVAKNSDLTQPAASGSGTVTDGRSFDANGNVSSRLDWNGNRTNYTYDLARNLETSRTEGLTSGGSATAATRTISTQWHPTFRLPAVIAEPLRKTTLVYNGDSGASCGFKADGVTLVPGVLCSRNVQATTDTSGAAGLGASVTGTPRVWTYTYNPNGSVLTVDGPRTDVSDVTTYTYHANNATCSGASVSGCRGQVATVTNAAGHVTQITDYNAHGQPLSIVDPNGLTTTLAYDARLRLTSRTVGSEVTSYTYDGVGQLTKVTLPDGSFLDYTYDNAHRMTQIADNLGNKIVYTLDLMGNRTQEQVFDPANVLAQTRSRVYNSLNRLVQEIGAASQTTAYTYDNQGNVTQIDGPLSGTVDVTVNAYDALNRLTQITDPLAGVVAYGYNGVDQLASVTDPRSLVTSYSYDGLNNLNQQVSPDTGTTANTYDAAGNLLTSTDAKGQVTTYTYDTLNRVTSITYQGGVVHSYAYDQGTNGKGRLTQITEPASVTDYAYDVHGRLLSETRTINGVPYVTAYAYDSAGRMTGMTYPSGRQVTYTLDALGRIQAVATTKDSETQTVVSSVAYRPFGPSSGHTFGNGQTYSRGFDQDGRIASYTLATQSIAVGYDPASRITSLTDTGVPANTNTYAYDTLDRLTGFVGPSTNQGYTFDAVGNRLTKTTGANTDTYAYSGSSNRLASISGTTNRTYAYDANGSTTADTARTYAYDARGRMVQATGSAGSTTYQVNSVGQRIRKTNTQGDTIYHYDAQGRLISETSASGTPQREYIYLGDAPVAVIQ